jgi:hypothetical protein
MYIEAKSVLPTMQVMLDFKVRIVINIELHYECVKLITYAEGERRHTVHELPKDVYLKLTHNPYERWQTKTNQAGVK